MIRIVNCTISSRLVDVYNHNEVIIDMIRENVSGLSKLYNECSREELSVAMQSLQQLLYHILEEQSMLFRQLNELYPAEYIDEY